MRNDLRLSQTTRSVVLNLFWLWNILTAHLKFQIQKWTAPLEFFQGTLGCRTTLIEILCPRSVIPNWGPQHTRVLRAAARGATNMFNSLTSIPIWSSRGSAKFLRNIIKVLQTKIYCWETLHQIIILDSKGIIMTKRILVFSFASKYRLELDLFSSIYPGF